MNAKVNTACPSTIRGQSEQEGARGLVYYGFSYVVPADKAGTDERLALEEEAGRKLESYLSGGAPASCGEVLPGGIVERFDTLDIETGDHIVLYRIPFRAASPDAAGGAGEPAA